MSEEQNTDPRAPAQPMSADRLDSVRLDIEGGWRPAQDDAAALLDDRDHWHEMYQQGLDANMDLVREVQRLNGLLDESVVDSVSRSGKVTFCRRRDKRGAADS